MSFSVCVVIHNRINFFATCASITPMPKHLGFEPRPRSFEDMLFVAVMILKFLTDCRLLHFDQTKSNNWGTA